MKDANNAIVPPTEEAQCDSKARTCIRQICHQDEDIGSLFVQHRTSVVNMAHTNINTYACKYIARW